MTLFLTAALALLHAAVCAEESTATAPAIPSSAAPTAILVAVGDIRLDGPVARLAAAEGAAAPVAAVRDSLRGDFLLGNLECALTARGEPMDKKFTFRAPPGNAELLRAWGFTALGLANNHVMDFGPDGLSDTLGALAERGLLALGAGPDAEAARRPLILERGGLRIGLLALTSTVPESMWAARGKPGTAYADFARFPDWIRAARRDCDLLVVYFHGGTELDERPNELQRAFVRSALAAGADLVLGHHPHVLQEVEVSTRTGGLAFYSLGNFLMVSPTPGTERSVIARLHLSRSGVSAELVPVRIGWDGRVSPAEPEDRRLIREALDRGGALSAHPDRVRLAGDGSSEDAAR